MTEIFWTYIQCIFYLFTHFDQLYVSEGSVGKISSKVYQQHVSYGYRINGNLFIQTSILISKKVFPYSVRFSFVIFRIYRFINNYLSIIKVVLFYKGSVVVLVYASNVAKILPLFT